MRKNWLIILIVGLIIVFVFLIASPIKAFFASLFSTASGAVRNVTDAIGLTKSAADIQVLNDAANPGSFWSPQFYLSAPVGANLVTDAFADSFISGIKDSEGILTDDMTKVMGLVKQLTSQSQLSYICYWYNKNYGGDFLTDITSLSWSLKSGLSSDEVNQITQYVAALPKY